MATQVCIPWNVAGANPFFKVGAVDQVFRPLGFRLKDSTWTVSPFLPSTSTYSVDCLQGADRRTYHDPRRSKRCLSPVFSRTTPLLLHKSYLPRYKLSFLA